MQSRAKAFWDGALSGSKFGAIAGVTIWLAVAVVCFGLVLFIPRAREELLAELAERSVLSAIGGLVAPFLLMVVYGAVPGAIIMGIANMLRVRRQQPAPPEGPTIEP